MKFPSHRLAGLFLALAALIAFMPTSGAQATSSGAVASPAPAGAAGGLASAKAAAPKPLSDKSASELWAECQAKDLQLTSGNTTLYLGWSLRIEANEACAQALEKANAGIVLHLNEQPMSKLVAQQGRGSSPTSRTVRFVLARDLQDHDSRKMWDQLLERRSRSAALSVALAVGQGLPVTLTQTQPFKLVSADGGCLGTVTALALFLLIWYFLFRGKVLRDANGTTYSLARVQMAFWFSLILCAFVGILVATGDLETVSPEALVLMGVSSAITLGSMMVGDKKKAFVDSLPAAEANTQTKRSFFRDLLTDANGINGLHRLQIVAWVLVLGGYFVYMSWTHLALPEIPQSLLVLLGISGGTYVGIKTQE